MAFIGMVFGALVFITTLLSIVCMIIAIILFIIFKLKGKSFKYMIAPIIITVIGFLLLVPLFLVLFLNGQIKKENKEQYGEVYYYAQNKNWSKVKKLIEKGEKADGNYEITPLMKACYYGEEEMVYFLVEHGADVNYISSSKRTPLTATSTTYHSDDEREVRIAKYLIDNGAELRDDALYDACELDNEKLIEFFLSENVYRPDDITEALSIACVNGRYNISKLLLDSGGNVNGVNESNRSVLMQICYGFKGIEPEIVKLLLDYGADISIVDDEGKTALDELEEYYERKLSIDSYSDEYKERLKDEYLMLISLFEKSN